MDEFMLTVLVPSYNHERYIEDCLEAVCRIDIPGLKVIVIDDGSTDATAAKARQVLSMYPQLDSEVIQKPNAGLVSSLNLGLGMAQTEYFYLVASDDIVDAEGLKNCVEALQGKPSAQFCIGGAVNFFENGDDPTPVYRSQHHRFFGLEPKVRDVEMFTNFPSPLLLQSAVFRTAALKAIGGWDPELVWDDYPTFVKMLGAHPVQDIDFIYRPDVTVAKYRHHGSNTYQNVAKQFSMFHQAINELAPASLKDSVLAKGGAYYLLVGLRGRNFKGVRTVVTLLSWRAMLRVPFNMVGLLLRKFQKNDSL